jgi:UDP-3-O-[3-hydroxymyristoyl] glucosamine N-acyltransferase
MRRIAQNAIIDPYVIITEGVVICQGCITDGNNTILETGVFIGVFWER